MPSIQSDLGQRGSQWSPNKELAPLPAMIAYCANDVEPGQCADCSMLSDRLKRYAKHHRFALTDEVDWEKHVMVNWNGRIVIKNPKPYGGIPWANVQYHD